MLLRFRLNKILDIQDLFFFFVFLFQVNKVTEAVNSLLEQSRLAFLWRFRQMSGLWRDSRVQWDTILLQWFIQWVVYLHFQHKGPAEERRTYQITRFCTQLPCFRCWTPYISSTHFSISWFADFEWIYRNLFEWIYRNLIHFWCSC